MILTFTLNDMFAVMPMNEIVFVSEYKSTIFKYHTKDKTQKMFLFFFLAFYKQ